MVDNVPALRHELLQHFHASISGGHSGVDATMKRLTSVVYWKGLKKAVRQYVWECEVCQRYTYDVSTYLGFLQPLLIPYRVWSDISLDFIEGLPKLRGKGVILVVVDRRSKYGHFLTLTYPFTTLTVAQLFLDNIYRLHGVPSNIIFDSDKVFLSQFWQELFKVLGTQLKMSTAYHPQTDGQTEVVNRCLETYLWFMISERLKDWRKWILLAEYWYNTNHHTAINTTPYQVVYGQPAPIHRLYLLGT